MFLKVLRIISLLFTQYLNEALDVIGCSKDLDYGNAEAVLRVVKYL